MHQFPILELDENGNTIIVLYPTHPPMLTTTDYHETNASIHLINSVNAEEAAASKLNFSEILLLLTFILEEIKRIMFTREGKPKSKLQIVLSIPAIIRLFKEVVRRINGDVQKKKTNRVKGLSKGEGR